jgi:hypothetical protein
MKSLCLVVALSALTSSSLAAQEAKPGAAASRVSIPLSEYESLRRLQERASVTVVDTLQLAGSFRNRDLSVLLSGRSAGNLPVADILSNAAGIVLHGCDGDAIVSRGDAGVFRLTPLAARFSVRCRLAAQGSDRVEMAATAAVLWVESAVVDGELVLGRDASDGRRQLSVVRRVATASEGLKASATGRYKITLRPDETRFRYEILVHNPNRSRQGFDVALSSGEHLQQVDAEVPYEAREGRYRFDVPPGEVTLALSGNLSGSTFRPPIDASLQYCVIDSHPLLRPVVAGEPKRVSPQEVGIATEYRGAQGFVLAGREPLTWSVTRLEALRTTSYAVTRAEHVFFLPADGPVLGQSAIAIDNQGAADVSLPMAAEPTFASLQNEPVLLTKDARGHLWLPIAQGAQQLLVQHRQPYRRIPGFAFAALALPQLPVPASTGQVTLRYPEEWTPLYEGFLAEARIWSPSGAALVFWLLLLAWVERVLFALGLPPRRRLPLAAALALAGAAWGWALVGVVLGCTAVSVLVLLPWLRARTWGAGVVTVFVCLAGFVALVLAISVPSLHRARIQSGSYGSSYERGDVAAPVAKEEKERRQAPSYQGLPAKFTIPEGVRQTEFVRALLDTETPRVVRVVAISRTLLGWLQALLVLAALALLARTLPALRAAWRTRVAALRAAAATGS